MLERPDPYVTPLLRFAVWALLATTVMVVTVGCSKRGAAGALIDAAAAGDVTRCERLVKGGVPVDAPDGDGVTALDWAVSYCKTDAVRKLIELGADVNHVDHRGGFTPLMYTATTLRGHFLRGTQEERNEIARLLIQHGADVNHRMGDGHLIGDGQTTLHFAAADKNVGLVRMLLAAGANPGVKSNQGYTPLDVAKFPDYAPNDDVISALQGTVTPADRSPPGAEK